MPDMKTWTANGVTYTFPFAPSGYGLGSAQGVTIEKVEDLDNITKPGFYSIDFNMIIAGYDNRRWWMEVTAYGDGGTFATQVMSTFWSGKGFVAERHKVNGTWGHWGWRNPPMKEGVEYCTSELCNGNAVYVKRIRYVMPEAFGNTTSTNSMYIPHGITNFGIAVRCIGMRATYLLPYFGSTGSISIHSFNSSSIVLKLDKESIPASSPLLFDLYYTKTA